MKKLILVAVLAATAWFGYRWFVERRAVAAYKAFAHAWTRGDKGDAVKCGKEAVAEKAINRQNLRGMRSGAIMEAFHGELYTIESKTLLPGGDPQLEVNGMRILAADASLANLPARKERPSVEADVLKLVCGIGTPTIHAKTEERAAELSEDRPRYLLILDAKGNHIDTHLAGVDGLYACRERGEPGRLHIWLVSYERIALIAHFSTLWPGVSWG